ncbi:MAG: TonB family protein [Armatimonadota bacterium]|nr:TonB family protein [bacterium]
MKDKILIYAIAVSIVAHLGAVCVLGRTSALRMASARPTAPAEKLINVDLVSTPDEAVKPQPQPVAPDVVNELTPQQPTMSYPRAAFTPTDTNPTPAHRTSFGRRGGSGHSTPGNPGGRLNIGSTSANGNLDGSWGGGQTPVGWVPGNDSGTGRGSGNGSGEGTPEPVRNADDGPGTRPAPAPEASRTVSVKICSESGMLPGEYCKNTTIKTFIDGEQPGRVCNQCKPPHQSRLADQANPILTRDADVAVPGSVDEGMSVTVKVEYTVTADGDVTGVDVIQSSGVRALDKAVISATTRLKYKPAVQDGTPRSVKMTRTYRIKT